MSKPKNEIIRELKEEIKQLKREVAELRVAQFYQFDDKKLKDLLMEV